MALVKCKDCGKEVSASAPTCPGCGAPIKKPGTSCAAWGCLVFLVLMGVSVMTTMTRIATMPTGGGASTRTTAPAANLPAKPVLRLDSWTWSQTEGGGYFKATGQVTNLSSQPLENVKVVVSFYTADGTFASSADALIEYRPLLPGQSSPFSVMQIYNPAMKKAQVNFTSLFGQAIAWEEKKKRK